MPARRPPSISPRAAREGRTCEGIRYRSDPAPPPVEDDRRVLLHDAANLIQGRTAFVRVELTLRNRRRRHQDFGGGAVPGQQRPPHVIRRAHQEDRLPPMLLE